MVIPHWLAKLSILFLGLSAPVLLSAQEVASITGVVTDPTGAVIPGVSVVLRNPQTGITYTTVSNAEGSYTLNQVKPGPGMKLNLPMRDSPRLISPGSI